MKALPLLACQAWWSHYSLNLIMDIGLQASSTAVQVIHAGIKRIFVSFLDIMHVDLLLDGPCAGLERPPFWCILGVIVGSG